MRLDEVRIEDFLCVVVLHELREVHVVFVDVFEIVPSCEGSSRHADGREHLRQYVEVEFHTWDVLEVCLWQFVSERQVDLGFASLFGGVLGPIT